MKILTERLLSDNLSADGFAITLALPPDDCVAVYSILVKLQLTSDDVLELIAVIKGSSEELMNARLPDIVAPKPPFRNRPNFAGRLTAP